MMRKYLFAALLLIFTGCKDYDKYAPVSSDDQAPAPVSNVQVTNIPGGATISYSLPESESLLYVLATYSPKDSTNVEKKSSYYNNSITIEGFPESKTYPVTLYAVSRGGKKSDPVSVTIHPLTPPVISVFRSLTMQPTFGGVSVQFENKSESDVKITVLTTDSLGDLYPAQIEYTKAEDGDFAARGFDSIPRRFGVFVRDRWNNYSDTLFSEITPWFEEELDKSKFKGLPLLTDTYKPHLDDGFPDLWDGIWDVSNPVFHTDPGTGMPQWFTFDLGAAYRLSRLKLYHRLARASDGSDGAYYAGDPEEFEIYGSNDPNPDGSWGSWTLLGHFKCKAPSSMPPTADDIQFACADGEDFTFPLTDTAAFRYLRFKTLKTWGNVTYVYISELTFWGSEQ